MEFDDRISSFEKTVTSVLDLCHMFEINPVKEFRNHVDNSHDLIVKHWLDLLKRAKTAFGDEISDQRIASLMREFLRIVQQYRERVILPFINRANADVTVTHGTKDRFEKVRTQYNDMVAEINELVKEMNLRLKIKQGIEEKAEKITEGLHVQEDE